MYTYEYTYIHLEKFPPKKEIFQLCIPLLVKEVNIIPKVFSRWFCNIKNASKKVPMYVDSNDSFETVVWGEKITLHIHVKYTYIYMYIYYRKLHVL